MVSCGSLRVSVGVRVSFKVNLLRVYFIHVYSVDGAIEPGLERHACDKERSASCKLRKVLKYAQQLMFSRDDRVLNSIISSVTDGRTDGRTDGQNDHHDCKACCSKTVLHYSSDKPTHRSHGHLKSSDVEP